MTGSTTAPRRTILSPLALLALGLVAAPLAAAPAAPAPPRAAKSPHTASSTASVFRLVVTDGGDVTGGAGAAVYGIPPSGVIETIASGPPLTTPTGVLYDRTTASGQRFFVSDMRIYASPTTDGALFLVTEGSAPVLMYSGAPFVSPYGMVRNGSKLYVADFGDPTPFFADGAVYEVETDPDGDGQPGPFPLPASAVRAIWSGPPLAGPNELIWMVDGVRVLLGDDSGQLFTVNVRVGDDPTPQPFGPPPPFFADPAGVARLASGYAVTDFAFQQVWSLDTNGQNPTLLHSGVPGDQFLGSESDGAATLYFVNARSFVPGTPDGEVVKLTPGSTTIPYTGTPLQNPFDVTLAPVR